MSDVYKVAVALSMTSNAPAFLSALSSKLLHVHTQVKDLEGGLNRLNRIKLAVGGGLAIAGGTAALAVVGKMVDKGNELIKVQQNMAQAGVKAVEVQEAYAKAWELTGKYTNVGAAEALKVINEARMTFGSQQEATHHADDFVRMISFLKAFQGGKHSGGAMEFEREAISAMKSGEIAGKITPAEMAEHVKQLTAMRVAYGDQLKISQYLTAQRAGGVALRNTSDEFRYGAFPALVQENGPGAGVMLMTAFNKIVAGTGNKLEAMDAMSKVGILDESKVSHHPVSGKVTKVSPGAILNDKLFAQNPLEWTDKVLRPKLDAITKDPIEQAQWISKMFPDRNAAKAITEMLQQYTKLSKDAAMMLHARQSINEGTYLDKSWEGQKQAFHEQWDNFVQALGAPIVGTATENLRKVNSALSGMAQWAAKPEMASTVEAIGRGVAVLGAALVGGGAVALLAALGPAGWIAAGVVGIGAAFVAFKPQIEGLVASVAPLAAKIEEFKTHAYTSISEFMPKMVAELSSWPSRLSTAISEMGAALVAAIGDMLKNLVGRLNPFSRTSFEGGDGGLGGLVHSASFSTGGANDNIGRSSGPMPGIPAGISMTAAERNTLGLIMQHESHGQNVMNYMGRSQGLSPNAARGYTAQGYFQILNSNWRRIAPRLGITAPNAMSASLEDQARVALQLMRQSGVGNWTNYNPALRRALGRGDRAAPSAPPEAPTAGPPPRQNQPVQINATIEMDGQRVARVVTRHQVASARYPTSIGDHDPHGRWSSPGVDAARVA